MNPEYIAHYGVKGMKWGRRKADGSGGGKPTTAEIKSARSRHNERMIELQRQAARGSNAELKKTKVEAARKIKALAKEARESGDMGPAFKATRGEKVAITLIGGPLGPLALKSNMKSQEKVANKVLDIYANVKVEDWD